MDALTIPNFLTLGRLVLTVFFFSAGLQNDWPWAFGLFVVAAVTDMVDGTIARLLNQKSRIGAIIDPAADKVMMLAGVTLLTINGTLPWWLMALIVGRDLYIVLGMFYLWQRTASIEIRPSMLSKMTTLAQILATSFGFAEATRAAGYHLPQWMTPFADALFGAIVAAAILTVTTAIQYTIIAVRILRRALETEEISREV